jgi:hypothetical protein
MCVPQGWYQWRSRRKSPNGASLGQNGSPWMVPQGCWTVEVSNEGTRRVGRPREFLPEASPRRD